MIGSSVVTGGRIYLVDNNGIAECLELETGKVVAQLSGAEPRFAPDSRTIYLFRPDITQAILDGRQPHDLTAEKLLAHSRLPLTWHEQRTVLGFA